MPYWRNRPMDAYDPRVTRAIIGGNRHGETNHNCDDRYEYRDMHIRHALPWRRSAAENDTAEAAEWEGEIDAADNGCGQNLRPYNGKIRTAIEHILGEGDKMRRRA